MAKEQNKNEDMQQPTETQTKQFSAMATPLGRYTRLFDPAHF